MKNTSLSKILGLVILSVIFQESYCTCQTNYAKAYADATNSYYSNVYNNVYSQAPPTQPPSCSPGVNCNYPPPQYNPYHYNYPYPPNYGYQQQPNINNNCEKCKCQKCSKGEKCQKCQKCNQCTKEPTKCQKCQTKASDTKSLSSQTPTTKSQNQLKNQDAKTISSSSQNQLKHTQKSSKQTKQTNFQNKKLTVPLAPIDLGVFSKQQFQKEHQSNINKSKHSLQNNFKGISKVIITQNTSFRLPLPIHSNPTAKINNPKNHYKDFDGDFDSIRDKFNSMEQEKMFKDKQMKRLNVMKQSNGHQNKKCINGCGQAQLTSQNGREWHSQPKSSYSKQSQKGLSQKTSHSQKSSFSSSSTSTTTCNSQKSSTSQTKSNESIGSSKSSSNIQNPKPSTQSSPSPFNHQSFSEQNIKRANDNTVKGRFNYVMGTANNVLGDSNIIRHVIKGPDAKI